ncbi:MAG: GNAT family N-acetyltransferase [Candidatus Delongbacteria bacterium]|nr:GNAT family N-acetyltransferase [Candidatus Delongbacteria bacterium]MBN2835943.1 GNAT family N-acetyltransferase [Candidatus Delongbacteria bacterium]
MYTKTEIDNLAAKDWAETFKVTPEDFKTCGTIFEERDNLKDSRNLIIWHCGEKVIFRFDPDLKDQMDRIRNHFPVNFTITDEYALDFFEADELGCESFDHIMILYPDNFKPYLADNFLVRKLDKSDLHYLESLKESCSEQDLDDAYIEIDHEIITGVFDNDKLVSVSSVLDWGAFYDVGVLTNPDYRGKGLGKASVTLLVEEIFRTDKIPLFRCNFNKLGSYGIGKALGFEENRNFVFKQSSYVFHKKSKSDNE